MLITLLRLYDINCASYLFVFAIYLAVLLLSSNNYNPGRITDMSFLRLITCNYVLILRIFNSMTHRISLFSKTRQLFLKLY